MSAFKQRLARLGASVGVLAASTAALMAVGGVSASTAAAACTTPLVGQGSSLQRAAQTEVWTPGFLASTKCTGETNGKPEYTATSSGKGLAKWRYTGTGAIDTTVAYVGTDDGPSVPQMENAEAVANGAKPVVVPVAQTAIAVVVDPPSGCSLPEITNANLEKAFSGAATTWAAIGATGTCSGTITRVVRAEGSGTTYQFKNYLSKVNSGEPCAGSPTPWASLEKIGAPPAEEPNTVWPECGSGAPTKAAGGGGVAETVKNTPGTIGYAALPDAKAKGATTTKVQDGGTGTKIKYAAPFTESGEEANCANAEYTNPTGALSSGIAVDWSQVFGGNPTIGGGTYPICTLTYDLGWTSYSTAGFGGSTGEFVKHYYEYILGAGSPTHWYSAVPAKEGASEIHNVQKAANKAIEQIS